MVSSVLKFALILLAAAVLAMVARALYVSRTQAPEPAPPPEVMVRVAAVDLPAGLLLRDGDLDWRAFPADKVPKEALRQGTPEADLGGALVRRRVAAGTVLTAADFMRSDAPGFLAAVLQPGMRAVSVPIDDVSGNAGLIQPGDFVDMILTQRLERGESDGRGSVVSETVVENARVIAVGTSFQPPESGPSKPVRARTVTLEVNPRAAEAVTVAAELGTLSLSLRSFALQRDSDGIPQDAEASVVAWDNDAVDARPVWGEDVSPALRSVQPDAPPGPVVIPESSPAPATAAPRPWRHITIIRGKETQELNFGAATGRP